MGDPEIKRGWLARWWKRALIGVLAIAALLWALDAFGTWPIEGYWWDAFSGNVSSDRWVRYWDFRGGVAYLGSWASYEKPCGTYSKEAAGVYSWNVNRPARPQITITVGLFRARASDGTQTLHAYRVPGCWLSLMSWINNMFS
jgi:hypothetical protein